MNGVLYRDFAYEQARPSTQRGGVTSIGFESQSGNVANRPSFWPDAWLEDGVGVQNIRRVIVQSDGKVWAGFRRGRSPNAYVLRNVVMVFTLGDLEVRGEGIATWPATGALPDNTTAADINVLTGLRPGVQGVWRWVRLTGSGADLYAEVVRRRAASEGIVILGSVSLTGWDPAVFGHWYARFAAGGGGAWTLTPDRMVTMPAQFPGSVRQVFVSQPAPASWARVAGAGPAGAVFTIDPSAGSIRMDLGAGDLLPAVLANSQLDLTVIRSGTRMTTVEMEGPRSLITPTGAIPTSPYEWTPSERFELTEALEGISTATDRIEVVFRPGPVWRWWSGEGDATFNGQVYQGALTRAGATLMELEPVEWTVERPDIRAKIRVGMQSEVVRRLWQQRLGTIAVDIQWVVSEDGGETYRDLGRGIVGRISEPRYHGGVVEADIETWLSDDNLPVKKWSLEGGQLRAGPTNMFFSYSSELAREGLEIAWPRLR